MEIAWSLVVFTALTGCGGWLFVLVAVNEFAGKTTKVDLKAGIVSLALMAIGGIASVTHLAHPDRMLNALQHPTSGIFIEAVLVGISAACVIAYLVCKHREIRLGGKVFAVAGAVGGVALSFMAGHSYLMDAVVTWNTMLLPIGYLGTAMASGVTLYCALAAALKDEGASCYAAPSAASGIVAAITAAAYASYIAQVPDAMILVAAGGACLGGLAPAVLGCVAATKSSRLLGCEIAAFVCAIVGAVCYRAAMWMAYVPIDNFFGLVF